MTERWRPVVGYEDCYEVSDAGRVRRSVHFGGKRTNRLLRPALSRGYPCVVLSRQSVAKHFAVHTLVAIAFLGPRPAGLQINHKNGVKTDNRPKNLEYVTISENVKHSFRTLGRKWTNGTTKLTEDQIKEIRALYSKGGISQQKLGDLYGVTQGHINWIVLRKSWKDL